MFLIRRGISHRKTRGSEQDNGPGVDLYRGRCHSGKALDVLAAHGAQQAGGENAAHAEHEQQERSPDQEHRVGTGAGQ